MRGRRENGDALLKTCFSTRWIVPRGKVLWSKKSLKRKSYREDVIGFCFLLLRQGLILALADLELLWIQSSYSSFPSAGN